MKTMKRHLLVPAFLVLLACLLSATAFAGGDGLTTPDIKSFDEQTLTLTWTEPDNPSSRDFKPSITLLDGKRNWDYLGGYQVEVYYADHVIPASEFSSWMLPEGLEYVTRVRVGEKGDTSGRIDKSVFARGEGYYYFTVVAVTTTGIAIPWEGHPGYYVLENSYGYSFYGPYHYVPVTVSVHFDTLNTYTGQFSDVAGNQWYAATVAKAYELGLMKGVSDNKFNPLGKVSVAEAVTMAARIHSIYSTSGEAFDQSEGNAWYQTYVNYAFANGIITEDMSIYPGINSSRTATRPATRGEFAEILANALPAEALGKINQIEDGQIPDIDGTEEYADSAYLLYRAGVLTGTSKAGTFSPDNTITRAEAATIIARMAESDSREAFELK